MIIDKQTKKWVRAVKRVPDKKAADKLISYYLDEIFGYVYNRVDNRETAKDVTQEIFILVGSRDGHVARGFWDFKAPVINIGADHINVNQTVYYRDIEATVYHVAVSPGGMRMHFSHTESHLGRLVTDNLGNEMLGRGGISSMVGGRRSGNISFVAPAPGAKQIIIIPVVQDIELPSIIIDLP